MLNPTFLAYLKKIVVWYMRAQYRASTIQLLIKVARKTLKNIANSKQATPEFTGNCKMVDRPSAVQMAFFWSTNSS
jgi:hypothetical protein